MKAKLLLTLLSVCLIAGQVFATTSMPPNDSVKVVLGCMNPAAKNFNPLANKEDGSCIFSNPTTPPVVVIYGCMNPRAKNFNPLATKDNGTCVFDSAFVTPPHIVLGCMNPKAKNFNPLAQKDDGTCVFTDPTVAGTVIYGCMDSTALNYNPYAKYGNHNCIYKAFIPGCTDSLALNYNAKATINDGSCKFERPVWGCTDKTALNYNPAATKDNGYCVFRTAIWGCTDKMAVNYNPLANRDNKSCIFTNDTTYGCTDHFALNFNRFAKKDNGTCKYPSVSDTIRGCMDTLALNYNPVATKAGKCIYKATIVPGCKSPRALNFNPKATVGDSSCVFAHTGNVTPPTGKPDTAVKDSLGKVLNAFCNFDFTQHVDSAVIDSVKHLLGNDILIRWTFHQGNKKTTEKTIFTVDKQGPVLLFLSIICKSDSTKALLGAPVYRANDLAAVSVVGAENVKAVTVSAYLVPKVISGVVNTTADKLTLSVYPNPVYNQLNVSYTSDSNENLQLNVYSIDGRRLLSTNVTAVNGSNLFEINASSLKTGMHYMTVTKNAAVLQTIKFAKF